MDHLAPSENRMLQEFILSHTRSGIFEPDKAGDLPEAARAYCKTSIYPMLVDFNLLFAREDWKIS